MKQEIRTYSVLKLWNDVCEHMIALYSFFYIPLDAPWPTLSYYQGDSFSHPMLITAFCQFLMRRSQGTGRLHLSKMSMNFSSPLLPKSWRQQQIMGRGLIGSNRYWWDPSSCSKQYVSVDHWYTEKKRVDATLIYGCYSNKVLETKTDQICAVPSSHPLKKKKKFCNWEPVFWVKVGKWPP